MITVVGKYGIKATILAHSISKAGIQFVTYEIEYPRLILAETNTHRGLSKNSSSSRAIPFEKMLKQLVARPVRFGQANKGMQDKGEDFNALVGGYSPEDAWENAKEEAVRIATQYYTAGYHKQIYNRLTEPFQIMKTVISGTEWGNFFWLRNHDAADPTIAELARVMWEARQLSEGMVLEAGEWHLPYLDTYRDDEGVLHYGDWVDSGWVEDGNPVLEFEEYDLEDAIKISCARCAAVSFRNVEYDLTKSKEVYDRLVGDDRKHASAFEHCATPMKESSSEYIGDNPDEPEVFDDVWLDVNIPQNPNTWEEGISHMDRNYQLWSGNLRGFIQYRKLIKGENYSEYDNEEFYS